MIDVNAIEARLSSLEKRAKDVVEKRNLNRLANESRNNRENLFYNKGNTIPKEINNMSTETRTIMDRFINGEETRTAHSEMKLNGTGREMWAEIVEKARIDKPLLSKAGQLRGSVAGFNIPLIKSRPAVNAESAENTYDNSIDSQMSVGKKTISPVIHFATIAQSYQLKNWSVISDADIKSSFAESFGEALEIALQSRNAGSSYPICGLLSADTSVCASGNSITASSASACGWADMLALVAKVKGKMGDWSIVCPTEVINGLLLDATQGFSELRQELANKGTIRGIKVVEIATAISHTAGAVYATAIDLKNNLKVCITEDDMMMREVTEKGYLGTYLQGATGLAAGVALPSEVFQLVAHS